MKPAPFVYFDPESIEEVLYLLHQHGDEATILAGGQSLGPLLNMRLSTPQIIVDINRVTDLQYYKSDDTGLKIGAMTRQSTLEDDSNIKEIQPLLAASIPYIGHRSIRNRGTVGGSVAHADPAAEWPAIMLTLDGTILIQNSTSSRTVDASDFYISALTTDLKPDEMLAEIQIPSWSKTSGWSFVEFSRRHGDFAVLGVATQLTIENGQCTKSRIAIIGGGSIPIRTSKAESMLSGETITDELLKEVAEQASKEVDPASDMHASAEYRRHLTSVLVSTALRKAADRSNEQGGK
jgi:carbon-monoxide dehydrogenase medium subunit/2-furoyl-CoA dehydrogenase FAD binding subunit